jgi:hypothetical protein
MTESRLGAARCCVCVLGLLSVFTAATPVGRAEQATMAVSANDSWSAAEHWVWAQLSQGRAAILDQNPGCNGDKHPAPKDGENPAWRNSCRVISASFLHDVLTRAPWQGALPYQGVQIDGADIVGLLDLQNARLARQFWIINSRIEGNVTLGRARTENLIGLSGTFVEGTFEANGLVSESDILLRLGTVFREGLNLEGARIAGQVGMTGASVTGTLNAQALQTGELFMRSDASNKASFTTVILEGATIAGLVDMTGASVTGPMNADALRAGDLFMRSDTTNKASFATVGLQSARIAGVVDLTGAAMTGTLYADGLQADTLHLRSDAANKGRFAAVRLVNAKIAGEVGMTGADVTGTLTADGLQAGNLFMRSDAANKASFATVILVGARIAGQVDLTGASVTGTFNAARLQAADVHLRSDALNKGSFASVILADAKIAGQVGMSGASVSGVLYAERLQVGADLFLRSTTMGASGNGRASFAGAISLLLARIGGDLDLRGARLADLDLSGASVSGALMIGRQGGDTTEWQDATGKPTRLTLRNTHIGNLADTQDGWPSERRLQLDGVSIAHLGGFAGDTSARMRDRGMAWWDGWARRDPEFSPAPYVELANAFVAMGDRDAANEIRFLGRARERETRCAEHEWASCLILIPLEYVAGFGIGTYTFRVLDWVFDFSLIGTWILWRFVPAARMGHRGFCWCCGASLSRLLPVVELNKEFTDFFNDPDRIRLNAWQAAAFSALGLIGWALGLILIAAVTGLTQNS